MIVTDVVGNVKTEHGAGRVVLMKIVVVNYGNIET